MRVKVKIVGPLRRYVARPDGWWELPKGTTVEEVVALLGFPEKISRVPITMLVNDKFTGGSTELQDGDELKLLWPVGGG